jgi:O-antigen ligase
MTTLTSNASDALAMPADLTENAAPPLVLRKTLASRYLMLIVCAAIVLTTLAYGTVHYWSQAVFTAGAVAVLALWATDAWAGGVLRFSRNPLQIPLLGLLIVGLIQLLPLRGSADAGAVAGPTVASLSFDPYSTRFLLVQIATLLVFFAATLAFTDSPKRYRLLVRVIIVFGFLLAIFGLIQSFSSPDKIYWLRQLPQSAPFGPFINRHHFAGYMEMTLALPLGMLFSGAVEAERRPLYIFAVAMMGVALLMTNSRGGIVSLLALIFFLVVVTGFQKKTNAEENEDAQTSRTRGAVMRVGLGLALVVALVLGALALGGEGALSRFTGTVSAEDPTTGRAHFWKIALQVFRDHPVIGAGLGSFGLMYPQYDTRNGLLRVEQVHNDYLQVLTDTGLIGAALGLLFIFWLFRQGFARRETGDAFRRGVTTGALAGCFGVLVHSFFDFTLHTPSNSLLFLVIATLATVDSRVEKTSGKPRRKKRRRGEKPEINVTEPAALSGEN